MNFVKYVVNRKKIVIKYVCEFIFDPINFLNVLIFVNPLKIFHCRKYLAYFHFHINQIQYFHHFAD